MLWLGSADALAQRSRSVAVRVVDVAGGQAYVQPGEDAGLRRGVRVVIHRVTYRVVGSTASGAVLAIGRRRMPDVGERGRARVSRTSEESAASLPEVLPLESYESVWPRLALPASRQHPERVSLGQVETNERTRLYVALGGAALIPLGDQGEGLGIVNARGRLQTTPWENLPLRFEADLRTRLYFASDLGQRVGSGARPPLEVQTLMARYGRDEGFRAALGRLRQASFALGPLDGASVRSPNVHGFEIGAFGGAVPDTRNGVPDFETARFGVDLGYESAELDARPAVHLTAWGSTFRGALDERRIALDVSLYPGDVGLGIDAEAALYDPDNAWGVPTVELIAAGAFFNAHIGALRIGARYDRRTPERSLWLDALLPETYLCVRGQAAAGDTAEPCAYTYEARSYGSLDARLVLGDVAISAMGSVAHSQGANEIEMARGLMDFEVVRLADVLRLGARAEVSAGRFLRSYGGTARLGLTLLHGDLDFDLRYGPAWVQLRGELDGALQHEAGLHARASITDEISLAIDSEMRLGGSTAALLVQAQVGWRPSF